MKKLNNWQYRSQFQHCSLRLAVKCVNNRWSNWIQIFIICIARNIHAFLLSTTFIHGHHWLLLSYLVCNVWNWEMRRNFSVDQQCYAFMAWVKSVAHLWCNNAVLIITKGQSMSTSSVSLIPRGANYWRRSPMVAFAKVLCTRSYVVLCWISICIHWWRVYRIDGEGPLVCRPKGVSTLGRRFCFLCC